MSFEFASRDAEQGQICSPVPLPRRLLIAVAIGVVSMLACWWLMSRLHIGAWDFNWALRAADDLLHHRDVYSHPYAHQIPYPLPAALIAVPLVKLPRELAGAVFFGASSAILAFGLMRHGYSRLLIFLAYPYWAALMTVQWTPLIAAVGVIPALLPLTLVKPQTGLPVALTHLTWRGVVLTIVVFLLSLLISPTWPLRWLSQLGGYEFFVPLLVLPGPLLVFALARRRDPDSHLLLLTALIPQRWFYDTFILWLIPKTRKEILATAAVSWGAGIWRWFVIPHSMAQVGMWTVLCMYVPMLGVIWLRGRFPAGAIVSAAPGTESAPQLAEAVRN